jgi:hypothetical protein
MPTLRSLLIVALANCALLAAAPEKGRAPVFFVESPADSGAARFLARTAGLSAWFSPAEIRIRTSGATLTVSFEGANPAPRIEGLNPLPAKANFLIGEERNWRLGLPTWQRIVYRDLYPGIDMVYAGDGRNLKSEFIVAPGADPSLIRVRYSGAGRTRLTPGGELAIHAENHELRERAPTVYQERAGGRSAVEARFTLAADEAVGFSVNSYDRDLPLVIDPVVYSTFLGGNSSDAALALAVDSSGSAYAAGYTASSNFPTANAKQSASAGGNEVFIAKLSSAGNGLVYCTYIGGSGDDRAFGLTLAADGTVVVAGSTTSKNFPVESPLQSKMAGTKDAFVLKLNAAGNGLLYSTYLGGSGTDLATAVALDVSGNAYVTGDTNSANFPASGLQPANHGGLDAFVAKLSSAGTLVYSTYLGGSYDDHAAAIAVDGAGSTFVAGSTYSPDFPVASAAQPQLAGGQDAFLARLNATGSALLFATYLGGSAGGLGLPEAAQAVALDAAGNAYLAGSTSSADFPVLSALQSSRLGAQDAFVAKYTSSGARVYSTYLGGTGIEVANAIAVDSTGSAYIAGHTLSMDLPVSRAVQSASGGDYDAFFARLSPAGDSLYSLSYLGGRGSDTATALALDASSGIYLAGWTLSTDFPVAGAYQWLNAANYGAFISKVAFTEAPTVGAVTPDSGSGAGSTFTFTFFDNSGASNLTSVSILLNASASVSTACSVTYNRAANTLALLTDAGAAPASTITPGSGSQQNSQCTLTGAGSSASVSGAQLTLTLVLAFQSAFGGSKTVYGQASNSGGSTGWQQLGSWTVPSAALPSAVSVSPSSGSGAAQNFTFTFSDTSGASNLTAVSVLLNASASTTAACSVTYNRAANTLALLTDSGAAPASTITPGSGSQQNSQCTLTGAGSSASVSGTQLTLTLVLAFQSAFSGSKTVYGQAANSNGSTGWQQLGSWTVPSASLPSPVSVSPASGSGIAQGFTFTFSDSRGYSAISSVGFIINSTATGVGGCRMLYYPSAKALYLAPDSNSGWLPVVYAGQSTTTSNSQCTADMSGSSSTGSGATLTVVLSLRFQTSFSGARNVYMEAYDGADSGYQLKGTWTIPSTVPPSPVSVTPNSGGGPSQTFAFQFTDPRGATAISSVSVIINSTLTGAGGCYILYYRAARVLYLASDTATAWLSPITLGASANTQNSQCSISASGSSASSNGNDLTVNLAITFQTAFNGARNIYMEAYDGLDSGWSQKGAWTVAAVTPLGPVSVTPSSGSGATQTFAFLLADPRGYASIQSTSVVINSSLIGAGGCYILHYRAANVLYLANDTATAWLTPITLGGSATTQNSQCSISASGSSSSGSGNQLTINLAITFKAAFQGTRNVYMEVYDGSDSGWFQKGTWTIP